MEVLNEAIEFVEQKRKEGLIELPSTSLSTESNDIQSDQNQEIEEKNTTNEVF